LGDLVRFVLLPGQRHDMVGVAPLIRDVHFGALLGDKAFDADWLRAELDQRGASAVIPPKSNRKRRIDYDKEMYKWRHLVETYFAKIIENAKAYVATGARAEWHFIIFRHNQHQIDEAFRLSRAMGFAEFTLIDTIRFSGGPRYEYRMPGGETRYLELPSVKAADFQTSGDGVAVIERPERAVAANTAGINGIDCKSAAFNRPYISAHGQVSACCWVTGSDEEAAFFAGHGLGPERYNIRNRPLEDILLDEPFITLYAKAWAVDSLVNCRHKCGKMLRNKRNRL